ncbi:MAG: hypothetical protein Q8M24_11990 [Pseudolabrys sp.]|nr:hypothetical protein [Pseudolabrys sp.]MDP2296167.1 hypothetical protein [Pseudolabrys sp.]
MDKRITFRFYNVTMPRRARLSFEDALAQIGNIRKKVGRERQLGTDFYMRAEDISATRGAISGELTRIQRTNFPSEIDGENRIPLSTRNPLGHSVVFRFLPATGHLGIQYDPRTISPGRFIQYVGAMMEEAAFDIEPIVHDDMWKQFNGAPVRRVAIGVAGPSSLEEVEGGDAAPVVQSMVNMGEAYEAAKILIDVSMGTKKGSLSEKVKGIVRHFRKKAVEEKANVTKLKAVIKNEDDKSQELDLLDDILSVRDTLELTDHDHDANYKLKIGRLRDEMNAWIK